MIVDQNSKVAAGQLNNESKLSVKLCEAEGSSKDTAYSLKVYHHEQHL